MVRVEVKNLTGEVIIIKEGNGGIYREVQRIQKDESFVVRIDKNATYREFVCVETESGLTVTLTSDDCIDYSEVRIMYKDNKTKLSFEYTRRKSRGITDATTDANIGRAVKVPSSWIAGLFKKRRNSSPQPGTSQASVMPQLP